MRAHPSPLTFSAPCLVSHPPPRRQRRQMVNEGTRAARCQRLTARRRHPPRPVERPASSPPCPVHHRGIARRLTGGYVRVRIPAPRPRGGGCRDTVVCRSRPPPAKQRPQRIPGRSRGPRRDPREPGRTAVAPMKTVHALRVASDHGRVCQDPGCPLSTAETGRAQYNALATNAGAATGHRALKDRQRGPAKGGGGSDPRSAARRSWGSPRPGVG